MSVFHYLFNNVEENLYMGSYLNAFSIFSLHFTLKKIIYLYLSDKIVFLMHNIEF